MKTPPRVDYDTLAPTYNTRFEAQSARPDIARALADLARDLHAHRILEAGCGTGHWLAGLRALTGQCYGLDPSAGMLAQARRQSAPWRLLRGRGERLPCATGTLDMVYCVNALHHIAEARAFVSEAWRVLRPGGLLALIGMDPHGRRGSWYVYEYFAGSYETDLARFPSWEVVLDWLNAAGFTQLARQLVEHIFDPKKGRAVFADPFLRKHAVSQLALLNDTAYAAGLRRMEAALAANENLVFPVDILTEMVTGYVRSEE